MIPQCTALGGCSNTAFIVILWACVECDKINEHFICADCYNYCSGSTCPQHTLPIVKVERFIPASGVKV